MEQVSQNPVVETSAATPKDALPSDNRAIHEVKGAERDELDALSKEVFGATSRWQTIIKKGHPELLTEEVQEYVPGETKEDGTVGEGFTRMVQVPLKRKDGANQLIVRRYDPTSVRAMMLLRKAEIDRVKAEIKRIQDEAKAKKDAEDLAKRIHQEGQGSAV